MSSPTQFHARTPFGQRGARIVGPADVESGLACGCVCPECGAHLVAKKGEKYAWHFAHYRVAAGLSCLESAIHAAAKQVLLDANYLRVPEKRITVTAPTNEGYDRSRSSLLAETRTVRFDYSREEVWETCLRPDVVGYRGERRMLVEMYFTHEVDNDKKRKLAALGLPAIEIDLSDLPADSNFDAIEERVLRNTERKHWLVYPGEREARTALRKELEAEIVEANLAYAEQLATRQRNEAFQQQKAVRLADEAERKLKRMADSHERYRLLPPAEKEQQLRETLGITGSWPYHLNRPSQEASAIAGPPRQWQAALFARFVFQKGAATVQLQVDTTVDWIIARFGIVDNRYADAKAAIGKYLGYLRACGFLEKSPYNPYGHPYYKVVHDQLMPAVKYEKPVAKPILPETPVLVVRAVQAPLPASRPLLWRASWPKHGEMVDAAEALLRQSPHAKPLLEAVSKMTPSNRPESPSAAADNLAANGVPRDLTIRLLVSLEIAI